MTDLPHNWKFINKYNEAIKELNGDQFALSTFTNASFEVFEMFAKNNKIDFFELMNKLLLVEKKMGLRRK